MLAFFASCEFMFSKWFAIRWKCNKLLFSFPRYLFKNFALEICCYLCALLKIIDSFQMLAFEMQKGPTCQNHQTQTCLIFSQIWWHSSLSFSSPSWSKHSERHFVGDHDIGLTVALATKGSKWRVKMISSQGIWNKFQIFPSLEFENAARWKIKSTLLLLSGLDILDYCWSRLDSPNNSNLFIQKYSGILGVGWVPNLEWFFPECPGI